jgi:CBS domain-containing protein
MLALLATLPAFYALVAPPGLRHAQILLAGRTHVHMWMPRDVFLPGKTVEAPVAEMHPSRVAEYMTDADELVLLSPEMQISDAACRLCAAGISGAPVVGPCTITGERRLLGVLSQKDLLHSAAGRGRMRFLTSGPRSQRHIVNTQRLRGILQGDVASVMSVRPTIIGPEATIKEAAALLLERRINRLPVVNEAGGLVGLISTADLIGTVTDADGIGCSIFD